jgi:hypothetical protein
VKTTSTNWLVPFVQDRGGDPGSSVGQSLTLGLRGSDSDKTRGHPFFTLDADQKFAGAHSAQSINDGLCTTCYSPLSNSGIIRNIYKKKQLVV